MAGDISREHRELIREEGCDYEVVRTKKHTVIDILFKGRKKRMSVPVSASDHRALKNFRADLRKLIRKC